MRGPRWVKEAHQRNIEGILAWHIDATWGLLEVEELPLVQWTHASMGRLDGIHMVTKEVSR